MESFDQMLLEISLRKNMDTDILTEKAPPDKGLEKWIQEMKPSFKKRYGDRWEEVLYALAWKKYNSKK